MSKTLMILGGSGFIGKTFLEAFLINKLQKFKILKLILISKNNKKIKNISKKNVKVIILDNDLSTLNNLPYADYIVNAFEYVDPLKIIENYKKKKDIKTLKNVFKLLLNKKFKKSKILYISSGAVYKNRNKIRKRITEKSKIYKIANELKLKSSHEIYIRNKILGEKMTINLSKKKINVSIVRCFALVGKFLPLRKQYVIGNFINSILKKKPIKIFEKSAKNVFRSFMHTDDLINWLMVILQETNKNNQIYNIGSEEYVSIWDLAKIISIKFKLKFIYPKQNFLKNDFYIPDTSKARKNLGLHNKYNLVNSLKKTLNDLK